MRARPTVLRRRERSGGFVLVVVLVVTCLLGLVLAQLTISTQVDLELSRAWSRSAQLRCALDSAVAVACALLSEEGQLSGADTLEDAWAQGPFLLRFSESAVTLDIEDESARLSLPQLVGLGSEREPKAVRTALRHFVQKASVAWGVPADDLRRWIVAHQFRLDLPETLAARGLFSVSPGGVGGVGAGAPQPGDFLTVWTDGSVNVNTASRECLAYMWGRRGEALAQAVVSRREQEPFLRPEQVFALAGAAGALRVPRNIRLSTESKVFRVRLEAASGPSRLAETVVVVRDESAARVVFRGPVPDVSFRGEPREMEVGAFLAAGRSRPPAGAESPSRRSPRYPGGSRESP